MLLNIQGIEIVLLLAFLLLVALVLGVVFSFHRRLRAVEREVATSRNLQQT